MTRILIAAAVSLFSSSAVRHAAAQDVSPAFGSASAAALGFAGRPAAPAARAADPAVVVARLRAEGEVALGHVESGAAELRLRFPGAGTVSVALPDGRTTFSFYAVGRLRDGAGTNRERFVIEGLRAGKVTERTRQALPDNGDTAHRETTRLEISLSAAGAVESATRAFERSREGVYPADSRIVSVYEAALWSLVPERSRAAARRRAGATLEAPSSFGGLRIAVAAAGTDGVDLVFEHGGTVEQVRPGPGGGEEVFMRMGQRVRSAFSLDAHAGFQGRAYTARDERWDLLDPTAQGGAYQEILRAFSPDPAR
ncbi:MAG: hypothetical protein HYZ75_18745 [Elusimicrobia bacterium]|nr:hypothetical protein [Elusimicrobiota bacterium]